MTEAPTTLHDANAKAPAPRLGENDLQRVLLDMVASGQDIPPERQLVDLLGVPRSRLRRVLARLRDTAQIPPARVGRPAQQSSASQLDGLARVANPTDVIEMRVMLEPQFARLAALRASAVEIGRIRRAADGLGDADYRKADLAFHQEVARASRNSLAVMLYDLLRQVGTDARVRIAHTRPICPKRRLSRDAEHRAVAQAIAERDPDGAEAAMRLHLAEVERQIHARLSPKPPG